MSKKPITMHPYSAPVYLTMDSSDNYRWYPVDPLRAIKEGIEPFDSLEELIVDFLKDNANNVNPIIVKFAAAKIIRAENFTIDIPARIVKGEIKDREIRDYEGTPVELLFRRGDDPRFPVNGVVYDDKGNIISTRTYSLKGECSDGVYEHTLAIWEKEQDGDEVDI